MSSPINFHRSSKVLARLTMLIEEVTMDATRQREPESGNLEAAEYWRAEFAALCVGAPQ
jgi:hypothetical protein